ncbi:hypothetical protein GCM10010211_10620 [Streptomyces albospinus]|uniref:Uncharacterized protein n=1 Tax=Streptomyces albospinus TaxID=285515 RepID=A0ABQ2URL3_9ACTN|nr:hypothetical protein GCM10010211_10620 [Streptomyces albospinus]
MADLLGSASRAGHRLAGRNPPVSVVLREPAGRDWKTMIVRKAPNAAVLPRCDDRAATATRAWAIRRIVTPCSDVQAERCLQPASSPIRKGAERLPVDVGSPVAGHSGESSLELISCRFWR